MTTPRRFVLCSFLVCLFLFSGQASASNPILVVTNTAKPFTAYLPEILKAEGMNAFDVSDLSDVTPNQLSGYSVAILGESTLTAEQASIFSTWVNAGGTLIAMRPDAQLSDLMGLAGPSGTMQDAYLQVNTGTPPGRGIVPTTIQYHGTADLYALNGATAIATLYSNSTTPTSNPAVTFRVVGAGTAVAFTYDLATVGGLHTSRQSCVERTGTRRNHSDPIRRSVLRGQERRCTG